MEYYGLKYSSRALLIYCFSFLLFSKCKAHKLSADISENGISGRVVFMHDNVDNIIRIESTISEKNSELDASTKWSWSIRAYPVDYRRLSGRCSSQYLGNEIINLNNLFPQSPVNSTPVYLSVASNILPLLGEQGIWGRSLLLRSNDGRVACATIVSHQEGNLEVASAKFTSSVIGSVYFYWLGITGSFYDAFIYADLVSAKKQEPLSLHKWKIFVTDILDSEADKARESCDSLQIIYSSASGSGDLDTKLGPIPVGAPVMFRDPTISRLDLHKQQHSFYLVIYDHIHTGSYLTCAKINLLKPITLKSLISHAGKRGEVVLHQQSPFDPTLIKVNLSLNSDPAFGGFRIHSSPAYPASVASSKSLQCLGSQDVFNPTDKKIKDEALAYGAGTQNEYAVGDLSGKVGYEDGTFWDVFLPLSGQHSVVHRSLALYRNSADGFEEPWACGLLTRFAGINSTLKVPLSSAEVTFQYPLAGRIMFRQSLDEPQADTTIIVEYLVHSDGTSLNDTKDLSWQIHENPPGKDFYNWTARCVSAGKLFDPHKISMFNKKSFCAAGDDRKYCSVGSISTRLGTISIAGHKARSLDISRTLFSDENLPLTGHGSIIGRSLVIFDPNGPKARGDRLACSKIIALHRRKGVVRDWFGNGHTNSISGKIEFFQMTEYDTVDVEMDLENLSDNGGYGIHIAPVEEELEFPCEDTSLNSRYDPYNSLQNLLPGFGTPDQYAVGDLSGKFGTLDGSSMAHRSFNDSSLQIFGQLNVIGRSVVIYTSVKKKRWACATIERGYAPSEARELRAIASFHHPDGFAWGYIRLTQLVHNDGSKSDTIIEVKLRHPGDNNRNVTMNHNWAIYVNPVGVDAAVKVLHTRCTAAGYIWNPAFTQLADPLNRDLYKQECGPTNQLRCYVGDLSGRLGKIDIGLGRKVFTDSNFPLEGPIASSAMGKSIVILNKEGGEERFACANIEPDKDIIKYANIKRNPRFDVSQFLNDVRAVMGIPEWFLTIDHRKTKILHDGACIQFLFHFKGPDVNRLEQDFSHLLNTGRLDAPSIHIHGYINTNRKNTIVYQSCGVKDSKDDFKSGPKNKLFSYSIGRSSVTITCNYLLLLLVPLNFYWF
nr:PREDICTED: uncharacterized protein LOC109037571 [Bemisia tabaci]